MAQVMTDSIQLPKKAFLLPPIWDWVPSLRRRSIIFCPSPLGVQGKRGQGTEQTFHCYTQNTLGDALCPPPPSYVSRWVTADSLCTKESASLLLTPPFPSLLNTSQPLLLLSDLCTVLFITMLLATPCCLWG